MSKKHKVNFYNLKNILEKNADYNIIFGERSNGKTYAVLEYILKNYIERGEQGAYIRRWKIDIQGRRAETLFDGLINENVIYNLTHGQFSNIIFNSGKWYLASYDEKIKKFIPDIEPFCFAFALNDVEHDKGTTYPKVTTVFFDEFLTRRAYLPDEFIIYCNVLSTIIRYRDNVKIFMVGNTVNKFCPYFAEMGLKHVEQMEQGKIDSYSYGDENKLTIAVEYCGELNKKGKPSDKFFTFDNAKLQMITNGKWELAIYPHLTEKYKHNDVVFSIFVVFQNKIIQGDIVQTKTSLFLYFHRKTTPIQDDTQDFIFTLEPSAKPNIKRNLLGATSRIQQKITYLFKSDLVFYQDNDCGEIIRNYILQSATNQLKV